MLAAAQSSTDHNGLTYHAALGLQIKNRTSMQPTRILHLQRGQQPRKQPPAMRRGVESGAWRALAPPLLTPSPPKQPCRPSSLASSSSRAACCPLCMSTCASSCRTPTCSRRCAAAARGLSRKDRVWVQVVWAPVAAARGRFRCIAAGEPARFRGRRTQRWPGLAPQLVP
jgi:hypothetical protein